MSSISLIAAGAVMVLAIASPAARADGWHGRWGHGGWGHGAWGHRGWGGPRWYGPRWGAAVVAPPVVYAAPPVVYYAPPPVYVVPPGISIGVTIP